MTPCTLNNSVNLQLNICFFEIDLGLGYLWLQVTDKLYHNVVLATSGHGDESNWNFRVWELTGKLSRNC